MNKLGLEYRRLILGMEQALLAQAKLRAQLHGADDTIAGHRKDVRNARARLKRASSVKRKRGQPL